MWFEVGRLNKHARPNPKLPWRSAEPTRPSVKEAEKTLEPPNTAADSKQILCHVATRFGLLSFRHEPRHIELWTRSPNM